MVGPWFTTPWRLVTQSNGAVAWRFRSPFPSHVPFPFATSRHQPVPSVPWTPYPVGPLCGPSHTPFSVPSPFPIIPCLYPTGPPATLWRGPTGCSSIRGPFRAPSTGRSLPTPPLSPVPRPRPNPLGCCAAPSHPSSRVYTPAGRQQTCGTGPLDPHPSGDRFVRLARVAPLRAPPLTPVRPPMLSKSPGAVVWSRPFMDVSSVLSPFGAVGCRSRFVCFFFRRSRFCVVPSSLHARTTTLHRHLSRLRSVLTSSPSAILWRGPWRSPAMPGGRPSLASQPLSPLSPPLSSVSCPPS